jgi:hypothetical protein
LSKTEKSWTVSLEPLSLLFSCVNLKKLSVLVFQIPSSGGVEVKMPTWTQENIYDNKTLFLKLDTYYKTFNTYREVWASGGKV